MRLVVLLLAIGACVDKGSGPQPKKIDPGFVGKHLLTAAPPLTATLNTGFGGKVIYLGNTVDQTRIAPGGPVKITHYWKVLVPPGAGWKPFTLFRGDPGFADFMALPDTDMATAHGPATWRAGEIIEDPQELTLRPDWRSPHATLSIGLIAPGAHGIDDRMAATGGTVVDRAAVARVFDVDLSRAPPPPGTIHVPYARGPITIDGNGTEQGWGSALTSPEFATGEGSPEPVGKAIARMTWDDQNLYVFISVTDSDVFSEYKNHDDPLWKEDCVEMFIDADGNKKGYVELQVNPNNATFDSWFAGPRAAKGDEAWTSGMQTAVVMRGTADKGGDTDQGWDVEIAVPWAAVKGRDDAMPITIPPKVGDRWKLNVVRVDKKTGDANPSVSSWNRITYSDFHALDRMLTVVWADQSGGVAPGTPVGLPPVPAPPPAEGSGAGSGSGSAAPLPRLQMARNTATIAVDATGAFSVNGAKVQEPDLVTVLKGLYARDNQLEVLIATEKATPPAAVVKVTDAAKQAGITKVAVRPASP
jgi:hypothetical protein